MLRELITINPRSTCKVKANPRKGGGKKKKHAVRYKRNPRFLPTSFSGMVEPVLPALIGGGGALAVDIAIGQLTVLPDDWKVGAKRSLLRAGLAFAIGMASRFALPGKWQRYADQATAGALTVVAYDAMKGFVVEKWPQITLGAYTSDLSEYQRTSYDALPTVQRLRNGNGFNAYVPSGELNGLAPAVR